MKITKLLMMLLLSSGLVADSSNPNQHKHMSLLSAGFPEPKYQSRYIHWFSDLWITALSSAGLIPDDKSNNYYWWISPLIIDAKELRDNATVINKMIHPDDVPYLTLSHYHTHSKSKTTPDELSLIAAVSNAKIVNLPNLESRSTTDRTNSGYTFRVQPQPVYTRLSNDRDLVRTIKFGFNFNQGTFKSRAKAIPPMLANEIFYFMQESICQVIPDIRLLFTVHIELPRRILKTVFSKLPNIDHPISDETFMRSYQLLVFYFMVCIFG